jgi:hypothetical protein
MVVSSKALRTRQGGQSLYLPCSTDKNGARPDLLVGILACYAAFAVVLVILKEIARSLSVWDGQMARKPIGYLSLLSPYSSMKVRNERICVSCESEDARP